MLWVNTRIAFNGQSALINCSSYSICLWIQSWVSPRPAPPGNADLGISQHSWNFSGGLNKPCHYSCVTPWHPLMTSALCEQRCLCLSVFTQIPTQPGIKSHFLPAQTIYKGKCRCYFFFSLIPFHSHDAFHDFFALQHPFKWHILSVLWGVLMFCPFKHVIWFFWCSSLILHLFPCNAFIWWQFFIESPKVFFFIFFFQELPWASLFPPCVWKCLTCDPVPPVGVGQLLLSPAWFRDFSMHGTVPCLQHPWGLNHRTIFKSKRGEKPTGMF